jgi:DNA polymerase-3 subunit gamma/tau
MSGQIGVGKTTTAYLMAKALMCREENSLGCGECPSCLTVQQDGIDSHADFREIDGALKSGVEAARETVESMQSLPVLGSRRVVIIDEAHFLSDEAWGAYLKVLEGTDADTIFIFITSKVGEIRADIRSRCIRASFERVADDVMIGHLANVATTNVIAYDLDALKLITRQARGIVRDAVQYLDTSAALGNVTVENVKLAIDTSLDDLCEHLLQTIAAKNQIEAMKLADELVRKDMPGKVAERMLALYSRAIYTKDTELNKIYIGLPDVGAVAGVLVKWAAFQNAPSDVITIIVYELLKTQGALRTHPVTSKPSTTTLAPVAAPRRDKLTALLDDEAV